MKQLLVLMFLGVLGGMLAACGGRDAAPVAPSGPDPEAPEGLLAAWRDIPLAGADTMDVEQALRIARRLNDLGESGLFPLLDILADPDESPPAKVLAVICLTPFLKEGYAARLEAMMQPGQETTTRACAVHLLGRLARPDTLFKVKELFDDSERRVRVAAILVVMLHGDPDAVQLAADLWKDKESDARDRTQIVLGFPDMYAAAHLEIFTEALCDRELEHAARMRAVSLLGALGGETALQPLRACLESETDSALVDMMNASIGAIEDRAQRAP